jgi:hypothetical protein
MKLLDIDPVTQKALVHPTFFATLISVMYKYEFSVPLIVQLIL